MNRRTFVKAIAAPLPASWLASQVKGESVAPPVEAKPYGGSDTAYQLSERYKEMQARMKAAWESAGHDPRNIFFLYEGPNAPSCNDRNDTSPSFKIE